MLTKLINQAQYDLLNFPGRGLGKRVKMAGRRDPMGFPQAVLAKGMMDYYKIHINSEEAKEILDVVKRYYDRWIFRGMKIRNIDDAYAGMALLDLFQITKKEKYKEAADKLVDFLKEAPTDETGSFIYRPEENRGYVYAEGIGMTCPFLVKYGSLFGDFDAINIAVTQINNYMQLGMDEKSLLPYHGYDSSNGMKMGIIGWGNATGILMLGMSETLHYLNPEFQETEIIRMAYRRMVDKVEAYQMDGGLYNWCLNAKEGPADTGASAMILASIAQAIKDKALIGIHKSRMLRGVEAIKACIQEDGTLPGASVLSPGFNVYPIEFNSYPWSIGPAISLLVLVNDEPVEQIQ